MKIMSHCDPAYFNYAEGLVKSIRYSGNSHHIILKLLDFSDQEKDKVYKRLKNINNIDLNFINLNSLDGNKFKIYTDCRPFLICDVLKKYNENLLALSANGLVFTNLKDIEQTLKKKDFVFLERETWFGIKNIEDIEKLACPRRFEGRLVTILKNVNFVEGDKVYGPVAETLYLKRYFNFNKKQLSLEQIVHLNQTRVSLLGALGISNNLATNFLIEKWKEYILNEKKENKKFFSSYVGSLDCDTLENDSFNRAYITVGLSGACGRVLTKETNLWNGNVVDTACTSNKIWFAKGSTKTGGGHNGKGKRYLEKLEFFRSLYN